MHLNGGKLLKCYLKGNSLRKRAVGLHIDDSEKIGPQGPICPQLGAIYICITIAFKHLRLGNSLANQSQILHEASIGRGNQCVHK